MSALVDADTGEVLTDAEVIEELDADAARALTDRIVRSVTFAAELVAEAWQGRAWKSLGYRSWEDYADAELPTLGTNSANRHVLLVGLRNVGMSTRAIASVTGLHHSTVARGVANATPDEVVGTDGKQYPSKIRRTETVEFDSGEAAIGDDAGLDAGAGNPPVETGSSPESPTDVEPGSAPSDSGAATPPDPVEDEGTARPEPSTGSPKANEAEQKDAAMMRRIAQVTTFFTAVHPEQVHERNNPNLTTSVDLLLPIVADWFEKWSEHQPAGLTVIEGGRQ